MRSRTLPLPSFELKAVRAPDRSKTLVVVTLVGRFGIFEGEKLAKSLRLINPELTTLTWDRRCVDSSFYEFDPRKAKPDCDLEDFGRLLDALHGSFQRLILVGGSSGCRVSCRALYRYRGSAWASKVSGLVLCPPTGLMDTQQLIDWYCAPDLRLVEEKKSMAEIAKESVIYARSLRNATSEGKREFLETKVEQFEEHLKETIKWFERFDDSKWLVGFESNEELLEFLRRHYVLFVHHGSESDKDHPLELGRALSARSPATCRFEIVPESMHPSKDDYLGLAKRICAFSDALDVKSKL